MTQSFDAVIVGGGLFGAFTGLFLTRMGKRVALVERGHVGAQSSGANFGKLRLQGRAIEQYPLSLAAQSHWENFESLTGEGCEYDRTGMIYLASSPDGRQKLLKYAQNSLACGLEVEVVEGEALRRKMPWLAAQDGMIASCSTRCAVANPRLGTPAVVRAMLRGGGVLFDNAEVTRIAHGSNGFTLSGPTLDTVSAPVLVNAAGAWAAAICAQFGEEVPLIAAGPPQFVTEPLPYTLRPSLYTIEGDLLLRQIPRGNFIFAGYPRTLANADGEHTLVPPQKTLAGMRSVARKLPFLRHAEVIRVWSGVEGYLPDMLPVLGPSQTTPGLFHAFGGSGGGFQIAPAVGENLAYQICGRPPPVDLTRYSIGRFSSNLVVSEKMTSEFDPSGYDRRC
ncbi:FAD-binding oxidoreductase [Paracoccus sp. Z118]|uniref:NAD(P)/FAD-dependent oxidoreductase n=1 Tax=Paracoccus sp. Z118 TaxID=2851017 RepID=UPI001C2C5919|nr:FAD-binding oxidoreductase [Paracoccus sp. Z118]MBV0891908.1 FAD-binding oxidoreductase [Paracoccus sp. Z118]